MPWRGAIIADVRARAHATLRALTAQVSGHATGVQSLRGRVAIAVVLTLAIAQVAVLLMLERYPTPRALWGDELMYWDVATHWAAGRPATLEPLWPPLYPWLLAGALRAGASRLTIQLLQLALAAGAAWVLFDLVRRVLDARIAAVAASFFVLDPQLVAFGLYFWPEVLHLLVALAAVWVAIARPDGWGWSTLLGVLLGLALLSKNLLGPFLPVATVGWIAATGRRGIPRLAVALVAMTTSLVPTLIDNGRRHGAYVIGDSVRFNLWVGLNDTERRNLINEVISVEYDRYRESGATHAARNRALDAKIRAFVEERGLWSILRAQIGRQYFRLFDKDSFFTDQLPGSGIEAEGFGYRALTPWQASALRVWAYALHALVILLAPFGALAVWRRHRLAAIALLGYVGLTLAICLVVHVKTRYRVQFLPALYVFTAAALLRGGRDANPATTGGACSPVALSLAGGCSALLLFFAFGRELLN